MYKLILTALFSITLMVGFGQLDKGVWIVGGNASLSYIKERYSSLVWQNYSKGLEIAIEPSFGYFIIDKMNVGLRPSFTQSKSNVQASDGSWDQIVSNTKRFEIGPFIRYYFLKKDQPFNILSDISYQVGTYDSKPNKGTNNTLNVKAGTVIYFNTSVGMECLFGYYQRKEEVKSSSQIKRTQSGLQISLGLQFHLEKY